MASGGGVRGEGRVHPVLFMSERIRGGGVGTLSR